MKFKFHLQMKSLLLSILNENITKLEECKRVERQANEKGKKERKEKIE